MHRLWRDFQAHGLAHLHRWFISGQDGDGQILEPEVIQPRSCGSKSFTCPVIVQHGRAEEAFLINGQFGSGQRGTDDGAGYVTLLTFDIEGFSRTKRQPRVASVRLG